jgi:hypothetical protein
MAFTNIKAPQLNQYQDKLHNLEDFINMKGMKNSSEGSQSLVGNV